MARVGGRIHTVILTVMSVAVAILVGWVVLTGWDFYGTALQERPHHPQFRQYRPAGIIGHGVGILGSAMVLLLLLYSLRKRARFLRNRGDLRIWLRYHIFLGVAGPILITLHTSFKVEGLVAVSYWSMVAVALSGVFGRYLYQQIPRNVLGETMALEEVQARNEAIMVDLAGPFGLDQRVLADLEDIALERLRRLSAPAGLIVLPFLNLSLARRLHTWSQGIPAGKRQEGATLARQWVLQMRRLHLFHQVASLFHYWHVFHKPFAVIMILIMFVHVAVALTLGYTWVM